MAHIDLSLIVEEFNLDLNAMCKVLFPDNKFPRPALDRILKGQTKLDSDQLNVLADYLSINTQDLYMNKGWRGASIKNNVLIMTRGAFTAKFNIESFKTTLTFNDELVDDILISAKMISLNEYIIELDKQITKYLNK